MSCRVFLAAMLASSGAAAQPVFHTLETFTTAPFFGGGLARHDKALYGVINSMPPSGEGLLFSLTPPVGGGAWTYESFYSFGHPTAAGVYSGGVYPMGTPVVGEQDHVYGVTTGGPYPKSTVRAQPTVYDVHRSIPHGGRWIQSTLKSFTGHPASDGSMVRGVVMDAAGNLFGTVNDGGSCTRSTSGCGYAFEMTQDPGKQSWSFTHIHDFTTTDIPGDTYPVNAPVVGKSGEVYISSATTIVALTPPPAGGSAWTSAVIWTSPNAYSEFGGILVDPRGNLFVSDYTGGPATQQCGTGCGEVFELVRPQRAGGAWTYADVWDSTDAERGPPGESHPFEAPIIDANGVLYVGVSYEFISLAPPATPGGAWTKTVLGPPSGYADGLVADDGGNLFGVSLGIHYSTTNSTATTAFEITGSGYAPPK